LRPTHTQGSIDADVRVRHAAWKCEASKWEYIVDLETWIKSSIPSSDETTAVPVAMASEIADVATRYIKVLDAGDAEAARAELAILRELCDERMAALGALPKRKGPRRD
jgi:hypothetical protein